MNLIIDCRFQVKTPNYHGHSTEVGIVCIMHTDCTRWETVISFAALSRGNAWLDFQDIRGLQELCTAFRKLKVGPRVYLFHEVPR